MSHEIFGLMLLGAALHRHPVRLSDLLHAVLPRHGLRLSRPRRARLLPDDLSGVQHHDGYGAGGRRDVHLHGLRAGERRADEAAVPCRPAALRARARVALSRHHLHGDAVRGGDRHRRRLGHHHRPDGRAGDAQVALRHRALRRHDLRRRHARHPHSAERHAGGDGTGASGVGRAALRRRAAAGPAARRPVRRLHDGARLARSETRAAAVGRRARGQQGLYRARVLPRPDAAGGAHRRDARLHHHRLGDADRRCGDRLRRRAARDRRSRQAHLADAQGRHLPNGADLQHGDGAAGRLDIHGLGVLGARHADLHRESACSPGTSIRAC